MILGSCGITSDLSVPIAVKYPKTSVLSSHDNSGFILDSEIPLIVSTIGFKIESIGRIGQIPEYNFLLAWDPHPTIALLDFGMTAHPINQVDPNSVGSLK